MPRPPGVRPRIRAPALASHPMASSFPRLATLLDEAITGHVVPSTLSGYKSAVSSFESFCAAHGVPAFPVDMLWLCSWLVFSAMSVSVPSLKVYLAGIRFECGSRGLIWAGNGNEFVRRTIRFLKRRYGCVSSRNKVPISISLISKLCPFLPGWPVVHSMSHDDRLWIAASVIATMGFLRGGEFLSSPSSSRPVLRGRHVIEVCSGGLQHVSVAIAQPKSRWWLPFETARCFQAPSGCLLDPVWLLSVYRSLSTVALGPDLPAFRLADGSTLSRNWMVGRTVQLLALADIHVVDSLGAPASVFASSWRAGGVVSAKAAKIGDDVIKILGRWASNAWTSYSSSSLHDLRFAARSMLNSGIDDDSPNDDTPDAVHVVQVGSPTASLSSDFDHPDDLRRWLAGARSSASGGAIGPAPPSFHRRAA